MVFLAGDAHGGLELAERTLPLVEQVGRDDLVSHVVSAIGMARVHLGDPAGLDDLRRSFALAEAANSPEDFHSACNNLANMNWRLGQLDAASDWLQRARREDGGSATQPARAGLTARTCSTTGCAASGTKRWRSRRRL